MSYAGDKKCWTDTALQIQLFRGAGFPDSAGAAGCWKAHEHGTDNQWWSADPPVTSMGYLGAPVLQTQMKYQVIFSLHEVQTRLETQVAQWFVFFHNIRLYKFASGLDVQKLQNPIFLICVKPTWFHNICTFFKLSQSAHMFLSLLCVCPQVCCLPFLFIHS